MNYLVDTHVLLWSLIRPKELSVKVKQVFSEPTTTVLASVISFWEISLKYALGKLNLTGVTPEELPQSALDAGLEILSLDPDDAASFHKLPKLKHKDPFDRILAWQAIKQKYTLISKDNQFAAYQRHGLKLFW